MTVTGLLMTLKLLFRLGKIHREIQGNNSICKVARRQAAMGAHLAYRIAALHFVVFVRRGDSTAASEIIAQYTSGTADTERVLDLLHTIAPDLSIDERRRAAVELAKLSEDDQWDEWEAATAAFYLASIITGDEPNPGERTEAAHEMVVLFESDELDVGRSIELMDTIAPGLAIGERRQAAAVLTRLSAEADWDSADKLAAMNEVFRLVTGVSVSKVGRLRKV